MRRNIHFIFKNRPFLPVKVPVAKSFLARVIVERSHVLNLRAVENDLSPDALVNGFTSISLQIVMTSFCLTHFPLRGKQLLTHKYNHDVDKHTTQKPTSAALEVS